MERQTLFNALKHIITSCGTPCVADSPGEADYIAFVPLCDADTLPADRRDKLPSFETYWGEWLPLTCAYVSADGRLGLVTMNDSYIDDELFRCDEGTERFDLEEVFRAVYDELRMPEDPSADEYLEGIPATETA